MSDASAQTQIAIAVVETESHVLVGRRSEDTPLAGYWEFPGGKVEAGETFRQAAVRECLEEAGLRVQVIGEYPAAVHCYRHGKLHLRFFKCRLAESDQGTIPRGSFRWIAKRVLGQYLFPEANRQVLKHIAEDASADEVP